jgi:exonuclease III
MTNIMCAWYLEERRSRGMVVRGVDTEFFNSFIADSHPMDFSLDGRHFTWFSGEGLSMSWLDRFLLSEELSSRWYNCAQIDLQRGLSDHCPLLLVVSDEDWGPKPFRMLK